MVYVLIIVLVVLALSLYNYFDSRDINQLTSTAHNSALFKNRNKAYGAYTIRRTYNRVITVILLITVGVFGLTLGGNYVYHYGMGNEFTLQTTPKELTDTTLLSLYAPPEENKSTLPPSYSIQSSAGSGGANEADQEEQRESSEEQQETEHPENTNPTSNATSANTQQQRTEKSKKNTQSSSQEINDMKDHTDEVSANTQRLREKLKNREKEQQDAMRSKGNTQQGSKGNEGSTPKTETPADYDLAGRTPFNNDNWWLRYPTYTCKYGGTVTIKIKVDGGGNVKYAEPLNTAGLDPCVIENAKTYAYKARFNPSSKSMQEGTLTYKFKGQ